MGKNMLKAFAFAARNPGWQSYNRKDRATREAIARLYKSGLVDLNETTNPDQFRLRGEAANGVQS